MNLLRTASIVAVGCVLLPHAVAQSSIGTVAMQDATVTGNLSVTNGHAVLVGNSAVVAKDHTAEVALARGGTVRICATSSLHLTQSQGTDAQPLMLALDRGAIEIETGALANDILLTPDLRFSFRATGPLDLRLRVTKNGDTCVENRGDGAPTLGITDQFGEASYELHHGQHVLFEHGSLKEVVDNESSPCGCPTAAPGMSIADTLLASGAAIPVAEQHPFPVAVSQGLAPAPPIPQAAPGAAHAQVSATLGFSGDGTGTVAGTPTTSNGSAAAPSTGTPPAPGVAHRIGQFFRHLFGS